MILPDILKQIELIDEQIQKSENKLNGPFTLRANPEIVQKERENREQLKKRKEILEEQLEILR